MSDPYASNMDDWGQADASQAQDQQEADEQLRLLQQKPSVDYYAILNVPRDATEEQIKVAYRKLCLIYHPDRQADAENKEAAERRFHKINTAYEVLTNPTKRVAYDLYGPDAAELVADRQVGPVLKTPEQIKQEYEDKIRTDNLKKLRSLVTQKAHLSVGLNATGLLHRSDDPEATAVTVSQFDLKYTNESMFNNGSAVLTGKMHSRGASGHGNVIGTLRYRFPYRNTQAQVSYTLLQPRVLNARVIQPLNDVYDSTVVVDSAVTDMSQPPTFSVMFQRKLYKNAPHIGFLKFYSGEYRIGGWGKGDLATQLTERMEQQQQQQQQSSSPKARAVSLRAQNAASSGTIGVQLGNKQRNLQITASISILSNLLSVVHERRVGAMTTLRVLIAGDAKTRAVTVGWMVRRTLSEQTTVEAGLNAGVGSGCTLVLTLDRLEQRLSVPILLSTELNVGVALGATLLCVAAGGALQKFVFEPRRRRALKEHIRQLRELNRNVLEESQREAHETVRLITPTVMAKVDYERQKKGLVILEALYGSLKECEQTHGTLRVGEQYGVIDVTIPVMGLVEESALRISGGASKSYLNGLFDPCFGEDKQLQITYMFKERNHRIRVGDTATVAAPLRSHLLAEDAPVYFSQTLHGKQARAAAGVASPNEGSVKSGGSVRGSTKKKGSSKGKGSVRGSGDR
ncbi:hypothetical protein RI367_005760 [Sorochytrium milnesiophthora]